MLLVGILAIAAGFRFSGLSAGLRHTPFIDEQFFVVNVEGMLERGDLDPRFHMYPGFFFYLLAPLLALVDRPFGAEAYLLARAMVAAFGVATVALTYVLGSRLGGARAGLLAAAVLAVSPVSVVVAHEVRPDVALGFFAVLALLAISRVDGGLWRDVRGGMGVGMATAIKFTGVALAFSYLARRLPISRRRAGGMILAGATSLATYAVLSPYSFLHFDDFIEGVSLQKSYHDEVRGRGFQSYGTVAATYFRDVLPDELGWPALLLAGWGLWARRRDWREVLPLAALPLGLIAILSTAQIQRSRYILSGAGALAVLAAIGCVEVWRRSRRLGLLSSLVMLAWPLATTAQEVAALMRPSTLDRVLDWTEANVPEGARIATAFTQLGLNRARYELVPAEGWTPQGFKEVGKRTLESADLVIANATDGSVEFGGFVRRFLALPSHSLEGPPIAVLQRVKTDLIVPLDLSAARLDASENTDRLPFLTDGDLGTRWETRETQNAGMWVDVFLPSPRTIDRIEVELGDRPNQWGRHLAVALRRPDGTWAEATTAAGRAQVPEQVPGERGYSQVLLLTPPTRASAVRLKLLDQGQPRWGIAELRIEATAETPLER